MISVFFKILRIVFALTDFLSIYSPRAGFLVFKKGCQRNPPGRSPVRIQGAEPCSRSFRSPGTVLRFRSSLRNSGDVPRGSEKSVNMGLWLGFAWMGRSGGLRWHSFLLLKTIFSNFSNSSHRVWFDQFFLSIHTPQASFQDSVTLQIMRTVRDAHNLQRYWSDIWGCIGECLVFQFRFSINRGAHAGSDEKLFFEYFSKKR